jgi:uncharacterized protein with ATP-grasp and redox domains
MSSLNTQEIKRETYKNNQEKTTVDNFATYADLSRRGNSVLYVIDQMSSGAIDAVVRKSPNQTVGGS